MPDLDRSEQSIGRAAALMRLVVASGDGGARLLDLAAESGIARPTAHRILKRLCQERLLMQVPATKRYILGSLTFELGLAARTPLRRLDRMRPHLEALAQETSHTAYMVMRTGDEAVCLHVADGSYPIRTRTFEAGQRRPLGTGAAGLALLSALPEEDARAITNRNGLRLRSFRLSETAVLERLERARVAGAISQSPVTEGVTSVAVVVPTQVGLPYLALSVSAISVRIFEDRMSSLWRSLNRTARRLAAIEASGG